MRLRWPSLAFATFQLCGVVTLLAIVTPAAARDRLVRWLSPGSAVAESVAGAAWRRPAPGEHFAGTVASSDLHALVITAGDGSTVAFRNLDREWASGRTFFAGTPADVSVTPSGIDFELGGKRFRSDLR